MLAAKLSAKSGKGDKDMSRIGKQPVKLPAGVKASAENGVIKIEGPKGKLTHKTDSYFVYKIESQAINVLIRENVSVDKNIRARFGLERAVLNNKVNGVLNGYSKTLVLTGVGYRAQLQGKKLNFTLGFSHPLSYDLPEGITAVVDNQTKITISGIDRQLVGQAAAKIKLMKPPEPYQGKGVKYEEERIRRKAGKSAAGAKAK